MLIFRHVGLVIFVLVLEINLMGLSLDLLLALSRMRTISEYARESPMVALAIILVNLAGVAGLFVHFFARNGGR
jgi:hypothetical protein